MRRRKYADLVLLPSGIYEKSITRDGQRHVFRSKDPEEVYRKIDLFLHPPQLFSVFADGWQEEHFAKIGAGTQSSYRSPLRRAVAAVGNKDIRDVSAADVNAVLLAMKDQGYSSRSVRNQKYVFSMVFDYAIREKAIQYNPVAAVDVPRGLPRTTREAPEDDAVDQIKAGLGCYWGLFPFFLLCTGCRKGEALALTGADIDLQQMVIRVHKNLEYVSGKPRIKPPKTTAGFREVPILDILRPHLPALRPGEYLFPQENGEPMSSKCYQRHWDHYCLDAGFVAYSPEIRVNKQGCSYVYKKRRNTLTAHQLRHGYATILYEAGVDAKLASKLLGHSDVAITQQLYTHIRNRKQATVRDQLNSYFGSIAL